MGLVAVDFMVRLTGGPLFSWQTWSVVFLLVITCTGLLRIDLSMRVLGVLVCLEVALAGVWQVAVVLQGGPEGYALSSYTLTAFTQGSAGVGTLFAMLCMCGIEGAACFSAETKNPEVAVGRATYIAIVFMALFYSLGAWLYIVTQGASHAVESATTDPVGSFMTSVQHFLSPFFVKLVSLVLVTSQMVAINAAQGSASRYLFALGRDKVLPASLGRVHGRLQSPHVAVLTDTFISLLFLGAIAIFRIDPVAAYAAVTGMGVYFLLPLLIATSGSIVAFYRKNGHIEATRWTRWVAPGMSAVALFVLFVLTSVNLKVLVGTAAMALTSLVAIIAIPVAGWSLAVVYRTRRPSVYQAIGNQ
jgi:amino acid transporter